MVELLSRERYLEEWRAQNHFYVDSLGLMVTATGIVPTLAATGPEPGSMTLYNVFEGEKLIGYLDMTEGVYVTGRTRPWDKIPITSA